MKIQDHRLSWLLGLHTFFILSYSLFSFSLTDPNLTLTTWSPYAVFQNFMWQTFFLNAQLLTLGYGFLISCLVITYIFIMARLMRLPESRAISWRTVLVVAGGLSLLLLISYNALSHDVFNYMFNAKMVVTYQANPHTQVALDFATDPWTRFMHNTHTPAPYGYGWTAISLLPYWLTTPLQHRFLPTWLLYRGLSVISFGVMLGVLRWAVIRIHRQPAGNWVYALFAWSPLVLIEIISNNHNDLWMMAPAVASLAIIAHTNRRLSSGLFSLLLLGASILVKLATLTLFPLWLALAVQAWLPKTWQRVLSRYWPLIASICLFVPLMTARSQQFHPWYLVWVFVWLPLLGSTKQSYQTTYNVIEKGWSIFVIALSFSSLYRYLPWLWTGYFTDTVVRDQKLITWIPAFIILIGWLIFHRIFQRSPRSVTTNKLE